MDTKQALIDIVKKETNIDLSKFDHDGDLKKQIHIDSMAIIGIFAAIVEEMGIAVPISIVTSKTFNEIVKAVDAVRVRSN